MHDDLLAPDRIRDLVRLWWLAVSLGALSVAAGAIVLARPGHSLSALGVVIGVYILLDGVVELYVALSRQVEDRAVAVLIAVINVIIGVVLIRHPFSGVEPIDLSIGIWLIAVGIMRLVIASESTGVDRLGRLILAGIEVFAGIAVVSAANIDYATLSLIVGVSFVANGIGMIVFGLLLRTARTGARPPPAVAT
jgi:uncharacterized membrane protein HdeD (DUF308 family)